MTKNILIFSDGTGQIGGIRPDQQLSNVYKIYRATRPGPDSPIKPSDQVAFYDAGLGADEVSGITFKRVRRLLATAVGAGIDANVIDCYEAIISYYEPGDRICIFGFSRGAYTARSVANVLNLCGVPTHMPDGSPVPQHGPKLRKIATDAVKYVYNHGAGHKRGKYEDQREEKARRFRTKYGSNAEGEKSKEQGNVQPTFIGVFDTVAALDSKGANGLVFGVSIALVALVIAAFVFGFSWYAKTILIILTGTVGYWLIKTFIDQIKYFSPDPNRPLRLSNPLDWLAIWKNGHLAVWSSKNYDRYLDSDVLHARHALAIDEHRADFPRVAWGSSKEAEKAKERKPLWLKQIWFSGCHSDIGGSYLEPESRLSDITLKWMIEELKECVPQVSVRKNLLVTSPNPKGLQHKEMYMVDFGPIKIRWKEKPREISPGIPLHPSVVERLSAKAVPQMGEVKPYRPSSLANHPKAKRFFAVETPNS